MCEHDLSVFALYNKLTLSEYSIKKWFPQYFCVKLMGRWDNLEDHTTDIWEKPVKS